MTQPLNAEQTAALRAVQQGRNLFLTGAGGTGKSHTIRAIVAWARDAGLRCSVTAMTGCAALLLGVGAKTLHSWAGIGLAREVPHELAEAVKRNRRAARRWIDTQLLIVDEVSMMTPELLEKLDLVGRRIRKRHDLPFGGLQVVFAGDFCQLPPVTKGVSGEITFVFESPVWSTVIQETVELVQILRQRDPVFQQLLGEARMGRLTPESIKVLEERMGLPWQENEIRPTLLFTRNAEVDAINKKNMAALEGEHRRFEVQTAVMDKQIRKTGEAFAPLVGPDDPDVAIALEKLDTDAPYDPHLDLAVGAQVMLIVNMDQDRGLVNGSRGVVTGFTPGGLPMVRFLATQGSVIVDRANWWLTDYDGIGRSQIPLRVAYAITIHKSQGATLDSALVDIGSSTFEYGQAYVALSRVQTLFGLYVWKLDPRKIRAHPTVVAFYEELASRRTLAATDPVVESVVAAATATVSEDPEPTAVTVWSTAGLPAPWAAIVEPYLAGPKGTRLHEQITARCAAGATIAPAPEDVFAALRACPDPAAVRVVILGQDPYPTAGHAHGLAFSVRPTVAKLPPSLKNVYKELASDLSCSEPATGNLQSWADQGVLLLNDVLTVTHGAPLSHAGMGWEDLTTQLLAAVLEAAPHCVILAWGRQAQKKLESAAIRPLLRRHTILSAPHPSPLSAHTGFFGSRPFSQTNAALKGHGQAEIKWI